MNPDRIALFNHLFDEWVATCAANPEQLTSRENIEAHKWVEDYMKRNSDSGRETK